MSKSDIIFCTGGKDDLDRLVELSVTPSIYKLHTSHDVRVGKEWGIEPFRKNADMHLLLVLGGKCSYYIGQEQQAIKLEKGSLVFVGPGVAHSSNANIKALPRIIPLRFGLYGSKGKMLEGVGEFCAVFHNVRLDIFHTMFSRIHSASQGHCPGVDNLCDSILRYILCELQQLFSLQNGDVRINEILDYINESPLLHHTVSELADMLGMTDKHFSRIFKKVVGVSPALYQRQIRIRHACYYLQETSLSICEISDLFSYSDQFTFSKQFKSIIGVSPNEYRKGRNA